MKRCGHCGRENDEQSVNCLDCGTPFGVANGLPPATARESFNTPKLFPLSIAVLLGLVLVAAFTCYGYYGYVIDDSLRAKVEGAVYWGGIGVGAAMCCLSGVALNNWVRLGRLKRSRAILFHLAACMSSVPMPLVVMFLGIIGAGQLRIYSGERSFGYVFGFVVMIQIATVIFGLFTFMIFLFTSSKRGIPDVQ